MQAAVQFTNGINATDIDHTFTTQAVPANMLPNLTVTTAAGMTPQPGVEMLDMVGGTPSGVVVTDLAGNVLWTYAGPSASDNIQGVKLLPNGDFLMAIGPSSGAPLSGGVSRRDNQRNPGSEPGGRHRARDHHQRSESRTCERHLR